MKKQQKIFWHKVLSFVSGLALVGQSLFPGIAAGVVYAQEVTPTSNVASPEVTIAPEITPEPIITPDNTPEQTPAPTTSNVASPEITPSITPEPSVVPTPTEEITLTPTPTEEIPAPTTTEPPKETGPPSPAEVSPSGTKEGTEQSEILDGASTVALTPAVTPEPPEQGQLSALVLNNVAAPTLDIDGVNPDGSAQLSTDKADYAPTDTVVVSGIGFKPNHTYDLTVKSDDPPATSSTVEITTDDQGTFVYAYQLDGTYRPNYQVSVTNKGGKVIAQTLFTDGPADIDQCANGSLGSPDLTPCQSNNEWVNGNLGASKSHYYEGDSIPYRIKFSGITLASHTLIIEWATTKSSKHAIDYVRTYNATVAADPCAGVSGCSGPGSTFAIPKDPQVDNGSGSPITQTAGNFTLFGGTITGVSAYSYPDGTGFTGDKTAQISITFTATQSNPVFAWGGHISTRSDWGQDYSAIAIPGSPYHSRLEAFDGSGGQQDKSLSADAVIFPASITISKDTIPNDAQDFGYTTTGGLSPATFTLDDDADPTLSNSQLYSGILVTTNNGNTYTIIEGAASGWTLSFNTPVCTVTSANGGTQSGSAGTRTLSITLQEGENVSCTFNNARNQIVPTVNTQIHDENHAVVTSVPVGSIVHDSATVTGSFGTVTGNVTFDFFNNNTCIGQPTATSGSFTLSNGSVDATTFTQGPLAVGSYAFKAHYTDDSNYLSADGPCEQLSVSKADTSVTTQVHNPSHDEITNQAVALGTAVHDNATVGTQVNGFVIGGSITYHFYTNTTCTGTPTNETVAVGTESTVKSSLGAASYAYKADYSGDANYNGSTGSCEPFTIGQGTSTVTTTLHKADESTVTVGNSVPLGTSMHDSATVTPSGSFSPTGNVAFKVYLNGSCSGDGITMGSVALNGSNPGVAHPSTATGALAAGDYSFNAVWAGNINYTGNTSSCENFIVDKANTTTLTQVHNTSHQDITNTSVTLGSIIHDRATVSGQVGQQTIGGTVTYDFFNNLSCSGTATGSETVTVGNESSVTPSLGAGDYSYLVTYSGDVNYNGSTAACEPLTVDKAQLRVTTEVHDSAHLDKTNSNVPLGSVMHDTATVSGAVQGFALPDVSFTLTQNYVGTCTSGDPVANDGTEGGAVKSSVSSALGAGNYAYRAGIADNSNYIGANSICEPFTVDQSIPNVTTTIHDADHNAVGPELLVGTVHDQATVAGIQGFDPTGTVDFSFYTNDVCRGEGTSVGTNISLVNGIAHPSDSQGPLGAGFYAFRAHYDGDINYSAADSACEPFNITRLVVHKQVDDGSNQYAGGDNEANSLGFSWNLDGGSDRLMGTDTIITAQINHDINENSLTGYAFMGWYENLGELTEFSCTNPESTSLPVSLTVPNGQLRSIVLCNQLQNPVLTISKTNDAAGDKTPGSSVMFTINVTASQSSAYNVLVTDVPALGFTYRAGSWTANSNDLGRGINGDLKAGGITTEPTYASPGVWKLGNMSAGETVTLTYLADISGDQKPGLYKDLAWAYGCKTKADCDVSDPEAVLSLAINPGYLAVNFVGTQINIVKDLQNGGSINVETKQEEQVLGAATELPATGADQNWIILATVLIIGGLGLIVVSKKVRRHYA